jgi:hypothetical protein
MTKAPNPSAAFCPNQSQGKREGAKKREGSRKEESDLRGFLRASWRLRVCLLFWLKNLVTIKEFEQ